MVGFLFGIQHERFNWEFITATVDQFHKGQLLRIGLVGLMLAVLVVKGKLVADLVVGIKANRDFVHVWSAHDQGVDIDISKEVVGPHEVDLDVWISHTEPAGNARLCVGDICTCLQDLVVVDGVKVCESKGW